MATLYIEINTLYTKDFKKCKTVTINFSKLKPIYKTNKI